MRVLLLAESFPPEPVVGAFRIEKLAKAFSARGHEVLVVVARAGDGDVALSPNVELKKVDPKAGPAQIVKRLGRGAKAMSNSVGPSAKDAAFSQSATRQAMGGYVRRLINGLLHLPDDQQGLVPAFFAFTTREFERKPFDVLYSSAPSFSVHTAALKIVKATGVTWIAEFRDPWRSNGGERMAQQHPLTDRMDARLEARCINKADLIVAVAPRAAEHFKSRVSNPQKVLVGLNGIEALRSTRADSIDPTKFTICYIGSLYAPRDPRPLLAALAEELTKSPIARSPEFVFVGDCAEYEGEPIAEYLQRLGFSSNFRHIPWLPQRKAQELAASADLLLLPAQKWDVQIPNKLFDYLGVRVPILSIADADSETSSILGRVGGHFVVSESDVDGGVVRESIKSALQRTTVGDEAVLHELLVSTQFGRLLDQIEDTLENKSCLARPVVSQR